MLRRTAWLTCSPVLIHTVADPRAIERDFSTNAWLKKVKAATGAEELSDWQDMSDEEQQHLLEVLPELIDELKADTLRLQRVANYNRRMADAAFQLIRKYADPFDDDHEEKMSDEALRKWADSHKVYPGPRDIFGDDVGEKPV